MTQEAAAERIGVSPRTVQNWEAGQSPSAEAIAGMETAYCAPWLRNHYCVNDCPLGKGKQLPTEDVDLQQLAIEMGVTLGTPENIRSAVMRMFEISLDKTIGDDELSDYNDIAAMLGRFAILAEKCRIVVEQRKADK